MTEKSLFGEHMNDINPLRQYFRRPAMYLKLPSQCKFYDETVVMLPENKELPVYPMTAIDEVTSKTPDALYNGQAVIEIIRSCVPNIMHPEKLSNIDLDAVLIAIRAASVGAEMDIESKCPSCEEENKFGLNLMGLLGAIKTGDYDKTLDVGELSFVFKPMTLSEVNEGNLAQFEIQRELISSQQIEDEDERMDKSSRVLNKVNELSLRVVTKSIKEVRTPEVVVENPEHILDFLRNCDKKTFDLIRDHVVELRQASEIKPLKIKCVHCQYEYDQPFTLNVSDFFE